jgi:hypothetical protein
LIVRLISSNRDQHQIVFDHKGFPLGQAEHLAEGWKANYWEPLGKYLAKS